MVNRTQYWICGILILAVTIIASPIFAGPGSADAPREGAWLMAAKTATVYDFTLNDIDGKPVSLDQFKGKVLLIVSTAWPLTLGTGPCRTACSPSINTALATIGSPCTGRVRAWTTVSMTRP